jgi:outer membrane protein assembly factor BamD
VRIAPRRVALLGIASLLVLGPTASPALAKKRQPQAPPAPEEVYRQAMQKIAKKRYFGARTMLQELMPRIPPEDRDLLPRVQLAIADSYYRDRGILNYGEALNGYRNFLTYYPQHEEAARAQFMVGMCLFQQALSPDRDQATTRKAIREFERLQELFPASPYVERARQKIVECNDRLAEHERVVGWFYQRRRGYLAAIDRYRLILSEYPRYSKTDRVLFDLGRCLLAVGNRPDAEDAFARLQQSDPKSALAAKARQLLTQFDREQADKVGKDRKG